MTTTREPQPTMTSAAAVLPPDAAGDGPRGLRQHLPVLYPAAMLLVFFVVPFGIMLAFSFFHRVQGGFYEPAFELDNYARFLTPLFVSALGFSILLCGLAATVCVALALPFTWLLGRSSVRVQTAWLVFILSVLSLSEVIVGFSWSVLLSRSAGVSNLLVALGLAAEPAAWSPSFPALLMGLCYVSLPYAVLVLYPSVVRLPSEITEAARTLGASPVRTFLTVVVPSLRRAVVATLILVFVFTLGSYLLPQLLGQPQHWTLSVLITDQAVYQSNVPFAAAIAVFLMLVSLGLIGITLLLSERGRA
ncbi:ABC transporter permease [Arenibaculum pallidiluteum]|uniref:ABC transporter permease n=1 Tax=Arenibaculum pallidiluteum TaxID=2812559 RepID=UPI001F1EDB0C|nr:ABC transporter permease [Arenibaculum pallidiluteum]